MHMRPSSTDPGVRHMGSAMGAAYTAVGGKVWHAAAADMVRAADVRREVSSTNSSMRGEMRAATDVRSKVWPSTTWMRRKMPSATASHVRSKMRRTATHVRSTARMSATTRVAAARMPTAAKPWRS